MPLTVMSDGLVSPPDNLPRWYVLNFLGRSARRSARKVVDDFNGDRYHLELFAPKIVMMRIVNGKAVATEKPLTYHYVFVRGPFETVKALCAREDNGFSFMLDRGSDSRYGIVSDEAMAGFKRLSLVYGNQLPFYSIADINLEEGDYVEVLDGELAGIRGYYLPKARSKSGNLVIAASVAHGSVVWDVEAKYIRVLEFSRNSKRQYDLIDAFLPKLYAALRRFDAGEEMTRREKTMLTVFCRRLGDAKIENRKLDAKLGAMLIAAGRITGDREWIGKGASRYERSRESVTNPWTAGSISLIDAVSRSEKGKLAEEYRQLVSRNDTITASRRQLLDEYRHYLSITADSATGL